MTNQFPNYPRPVPTDIDFDVYDYIDDVQSILVEEDLRIYGNAFCTLDGDGKLTRVSPSDVLIDPEGDMTLES